MILSSMYYVNYIIRSTVAKRQQKIRLFIMLHYHPSTHTQQVRNFWLEMYSHVAIDIMKSKIEIYAFTLHGLYHCMK